MSTITEIHRGRQALIAGQARSALAYFHRAAELDPDFLYFSTLPQSARTYAGRALYRLGELSEARRAFELAVARFEDDQMARLYLGLTLVREGEEKKGLRQAVAGLNGIHDWLEHTEAHLPQGIFWDPAREIRSEIENLIKQTTEESMTCSEFIQAAEWIGERMEREIDLARRDEQISRNRDG
jgi:tetratricopeptide (TPR) repeat protein